MKIMKKALIEVWLLWLAKLFWRSNVRLRRVEGLSDFGPESRLNTTIGLFTQKLCHVTGIRQRRVLSAIEIDGPMGPLWYISGPSQNPKENKALFAETMERSIRKWREADE